MYQQVFGIYMLPLFTQLSDSLIFINNKTAYSAHNYCDPLKRKILINIEIQRFSKLTMLPIFGFNP